MQPGNYFYCCHTLVKLCAFVMQDLVGWEEYLRIQALGSLRELAVDAWGIKFPSWSASLSRLTKLTGLTLLHYFMHAMDTQAYVAAVEAMDTQAYVNVVKADKMFVKASMYALPQHLLELKSLMEVELSARISHVTFWCQHYLEAVLSLPRVAKVQFSWSERDGMYAYGVTKDLDRRCQQAECELIRKGVLNCLFFTLANANNLYDELWDTREEWDRGLVIIRVIDRNI